MKVLIAATFLIMSFLTWADSKKNQNIPSAFDVLPLNSPVKESAAKFLLKTPVGFDINKISYSIKNASRLFDKDKPRHSINLIDGPQGKELHIPVSKLTPGFYQLFIKIIDKKNKEYDYLNKYKDHAMFVIDNSLQVPIPDPKLNDKTIAGLDSDSDGIRDDIQRWINESFSTQPKIKMGMKQLAMSKQLELISVSIKEQSVLASKKTLDSSNCLGDIIGTDAMAKLQRELNTKLLNTKDRLYADIKSNSNFSGQGYELPNTKEEGLALCDFDTNIP